MEKSQWDLKHIRFRSSRLTRLDDFVVQYQSTHIALLKEYEDSKRDARRKVSILDYSYQQTGCLIFSTQIISRHFPTYKNTTYKNTTDLCGLVFDAMNAYLPVEV